MDKTAERILSRIDANADRIISFADDIFRAAEPGYHEVRTAGKVAEIFRELGIQTEEHIAITGVRGTIGEAKGQALALIGELDGIVCPEHPYASPQTYASHACGHNVQLAALIGSAFALSDPEIASQLGARIRLLAVPAEEYRGEAAALSLAGKVKYGKSGKSEFLYQGYFDDIAAFVTHHVHYYPCDADALIGSNSTNGFQSKTVTYIGKAAHAGGAPWDGINALNAAAIGLNALAYAREAFREEDHVRVHPVIREAGQAVNVVPDRAVLEMMVRAGTLSAIEDAAGKTDRAFLAGAVATGAEIQIESSMGCFPVLPSAPCKALLEVTSMLPDADIRPVDLRIHNSLSTDVGDLSHLYPIVNFTTGGFTGGLHQKDFAIPDPYKAYLLPAKIMALTAYNLVKNNASELSTLRDAFSPVLTKEEYFAIMDKH